MNGTGRCIVLLVCVSLNIHDVEITTEGGNE